MRIAVLEDEPEWQDIIRQILDSAGLKMTLYATSEKFLELFRAEEFDVVVTDIQLKGSAHNGVEVRRILRARGVQTPVLVLTLHTERFGSSQTLLDGADDYIRKPFEPEELIARLYALARRATPGALQEQAIGKLRINQQYRTVHYDGNEIHLAAQSFDILSLLCDSVGGLVSHDTLWRKIWFDRPLQEPDMTPIQTAMSRLRNELKKYGAEHLLLTVRTRGYKIEAPEWLGI